MRVLLFNSDFGLEKENRIMPLTMYSLGAVLREHGHNIRIIDPGLYRSGFYTENIDTYLLEICNDYDVIAFSTNSFSWSRVRCHIEHLREDDYAGKIIIGGVHATHVFRHILMTTTVDYIILGEGELSFPKLLEALEGKCNVDESPGIAYRKNGEIVQTKGPDLISFSNAIPLPAYDLVPKGAYKMFSFESSRGCYGNCSFCSIIFKKCWRGYDAATVLERLNQTKEIMKHKLQALELDFTDDYFTGDVERAKSILKALAATEFRNYSFLIESRLKNLFDQDLIGLLKRYPFVSIQVGIESGYDEGLAMIRKGINCQDIIKAAELLYENNLAANTLFSFIIGFPEEDKKHILKTVYTAGYLKSKYNLNINCVWWLAMPSPEFDKLKMMNSEVNDSIFDQIDWHKNRDIFYQTHPLITQKDCIEINEIINLYGALGFSLRF